MEDKIILYIGNNLTGKTKYNSTISVLSQLLISEGYGVVVASSKMNKILRILDMILITIKNRNKTNYLLIDTFSTTNFYYALIISQLSRILKIKYIPILHGGSLPKRLSNNKKLSKLIFKNSYKNIAPSNYLKHEFDKKGYHTTFIPNILEIENYQFKIRKILKPKLLWVRAFKHIYNPTMAIEVLKLLREVYENASLCMVGPFVDSSFKETLDIVKKYDLEDAVEFTDVLLKEDWHKKSIDYDVFLNTTNIDNTPVSVMEAMALGISVVSTNVGGVPYLIDDKVDGILVEKNDPKQMTKEIINILDNKYPNLTIKARTKVENFRWKNNREKWFNILK